MKNLAYIRTVVLLKVKWSKYQTIKGLFKSRIRHSFTFYTAAMIKSP